MKEYDIVIIGGGPSGMAAAVEAFNKGIKNIIILEREKQLGGILLQCIHNGFGIQEFNAELTGPEFAQRYIDIINELQIPYCLETTVTKINDNKVVELINGYGYQKINAKTIILAMGCREKSRQSITIPGSRPTGVLSAGTAQKYLNMEGYLVGKKVFILGSGDIGLIMARRMTLEGAQVLGVAEILAHASGLSRNIVQCLDDFDIPLYLSHTVTKIIGKGRLKAIELSRVDKNLQVIPNTQKIIEVDTLLLSVGLVPDNDISEYAGIKLSQATKGAIVDNSLETSLSGVFACGNVLHVHDIVDFVVEEARVCIQGVINYLQKKDNNGSIIKLEPLQGITYTVPHTLNTVTLKSKQKIYFRVSKVAHKVKIRVRFDTNIYCEFYKTHVLPAEMEYIEIDLSSCTQYPKQISLELVEE